MKQSSPQGIPKYIPNLPTQKPGALVEVIESFLLSRRVGNCTERTLGFYHDCLYQFSKFPGPGLDCDTLHLQKYLTSLQGRMQSITIHKRYRVLQTFFSWAVSANLLSVSPMKGGSKSSSSKQPTCGPAEAVAKKLADQFRKANK